MGEAAMDGAVLAVDVGNSVTNLGLVRDGELAATWAATTFPRMTPDEAASRIADFLAARGGGAQVADGIVASVVPGLTDAWVEALRNACGQRPLVVGPGLRTGLRLNLRDPAELGADRVADLVAAKAAYPCPLMVVDFGTATNLEVMDAEGTVLGGILAPGLRLAARAVADAAAQLAVVDLRAPASVIGRTTREAMQAGIVIGEVARIDGLVDAVWRELGYKTQVVATGEDAPAMAALSQRITCADEHLTLKGLALLHAMNRKPRAKR